MSKMIRSKRVLGLFVFSLLFLSAVFISQVSAEKKVYKLKIQSAFPRGDLSMETLKVFADSAEKYSNGQLNIKIFAEPEIMPGDQLFGGTQLGVVDMLHSMGGMSGGIVPIGYVEFNLPLAFRIDEKDTFEEKAQAVRDFYLNNGFMDLLRKEYAKHDLYLLDIHTYGPVPFVLSTKPVASCADLKGMRIKAEGGNLAFHGAVGMQGTAVSPTETYMSLKLGTIDAAEWDVSAVTGLKWHEVAPYWIRGMECDHTTGHILVNMKKWDALSDDLKAALHKAAEDYWYATVTAYENEIEVVKGLVKQGKVTEIMLDEACREQYRKAAYEMWDEMAKQDDASAQAIKMIKSWRGIK
ncbi:MAG: TRAP transporter substrate-binding protein DctP [Proteobacteria bacterium]|nr:TRAP transporter substrate-binding protein DctP [Pseudomonadota bacterium]MBU1584428.1 TRAP transporter substrate-binding protein DctP [Pseudomonadota bacterium]MBU2453648.1 TRAP transporter substrate-binding protein DctP [Pseudomonadota bacterium]MBU2630402.1 TRAP transporter substrate-binding protein DctP [Pseudomonadota bacterium]